MGSTVGANWRNFDRVAEHETKCATTYAMRKDSEVQSQSVVFNVLAALFWIFQFSVAEAASSKSFKEGVFQASSDNRVLSAFYKSQNYEGLWTARGSKARNRRIAFLKALEMAPSHGLPATRYRLDEIEAEIKRTGNATERGRLDVKISKLFLQFASDIGSGVVDPRRVDKEIARRRPIRDQITLLNGLIKGSAIPFIAGLAPNTDEYRGLLAAKASLERTKRRGGWGPTLARRTLRPGDTGGAVVALKDRLTSLGYLRRSSGNVFNDDVVGAVIKFQAAHGLSADGVVGAGTIAMLNVGVETRIGQIIVAMERERWLNFDRGGRHVEVNLTDYSAKIIDNGKTSFSTVAVTGAAKDNRRTPEFSDEMEFMIFNPSWYVPASIATNEYLPLFQKDPNSLSHLQLLTTSFKPVDRASVDFALLDEDNWPFYLREPPSQTNALGLVKFMFPNLHNIYLHDTPQKSLFAKQTRAFSHGCVRLEDPFGFAAALLARQTTNPKAQISKALANDGEYQINLKDHVPVHIIYRTALINDVGDLEFRRDIYGRDAKVLTALKRAGVFVPAS